jgi:hypothetical protein
MSCRRAYYKGNDDTEGGAGGRHRRQPGWVEGHGAADRGWKRHRKILP